MRWVTYFASRLAIMHGLSGVAHTSVQGTCLGLVLEAQNMVIYRLEMLTLGTLLPSTDINFQKQTPHDQSCLLDAN